MKDYCLYPNQCGSGMDCSECHQKRIAELEAFIEKQTKEWMEQRRKIEQLEASQQAAIDAALESVEEMIKSRFDEDPHNDYEMGENHAYNAMYEFIESIKDTHPLAEMQAENEKLKAIAYSDDGAGGEGMKLYLDNKDLKTKLDAAENDAAKAHATAVDLYETLEFYADPDTYFAVAIISDPPCGELIDDFSETPAFGFKPGKRARECINKVMAMWQEVNDEQS